MCSLEMEGRDRVSKVFKYLRIKYKLKKVLGKIWYNKQCLSHNVVPNYALVKIKNNSIVAKKVKEQSEKLWVKLEIRSLYSLVNKYNKQLLSRHMELLEIYTHEEIEEIIYNFGKEYIENKMKKRSKVLEEKLNKLIKKKGKEKTNLIKYDYNKRVVNLTNVIFNDEEKELLGKGLKYAPPPTINQEETIIECETIIQKLKNEEDKKQIRGQISSLVNSIYVGERYNSNKDRRSKIVLSTLRKKVKENELITTKADKGNTMVILKNNEYISKTEKFIKEGPYKEVTSDHTSKFQARIKKLMKERNFINEYKKKSLIESNPSIPKFRSQVKLHKEGLPIRPIVSFINAPTYKISKEVSRILKEVYNFEVKYSILNNIELINELRNIEINGNMMLWSLDIKDM